MLHWYDLGSRGGSGFDGLWKYPDGQPDHAILVVVTDRAGVVVEVDADRLPGSVEARRFERELWAERTDRMSMLGDLVATLDPVGQPLPTTAEQLGPPDGSRVLVDAAWELRVPCPIGLLNWDVFFYWPSETYPDYAYGGSVERIGGWAYVHE
jgi:hypothetical protein